MLWISSVLSIVLWTMTTLHPTSGCNTITSVNVSPTEMDIRSHNSSGSYANNLDLCWNFTVDGMNFTKITIDSFSLEFWHDYLKLSVGRPGNGYFILFAGNPVELVGYFDQTDKGDIKAHFHTDSSNTSTGFHLKVSSVSATDFDKLIKEKIDFHLMQSPVYFTSQGTGEQATGVDLMVASFDNDGDFSKAWKEAVELLGPSTPNGLTVQDIGADEITFNWNGLGDFQPKNITINNRTTPWNEKGQTTRFLELSSGTTFTIQVTVVNKNGATAQFYVTVKTKKARCEDGVTCGTNALCKSGACECNAGYRGDPTVACHAFCGNHTEGDLTFEAAVAGQTTNSKETCDNGLAKGSMVCESKSGEKAKYVNLVRIRACDQTVVEITSELTNTTSTKNITIQAEQLQLTTSNIKEKLTEREVTDIALYCDVLKRFSRVKKVELKVLESTVNTIANMIQSQSIPRGSQNESDISNARSLLASINVLANNVHIPSKEGTKDIITDAMLVQVSTSPGRTDINYEATTSSNSSDNNTKLLINITVPRTVLEKVKNVEGAGLLRVSFVVHLVKHLFPSPNTTNVAVISAVNLGTREGRIEGFPARVKLHFLTDNRTRTMSTGNRSKSFVSDFHRSCHQPECAYWNETVNDWRTDGSYWVHGDAGGKTCAYDHLTNFAVLMTFHNLKPNIGVEIWSIVGLSLSIAGLALTIIIHMLKEDVRKRRPTVILTQICACLIISHLIFMIGIKRIELGGSCTAIAAFLQYFYLASWMWMAIYAYDMYRSLVLVFHAAGSHYFTKIALFGYGAPAIITALNVGTAVGYVDKRMAEGDTSSDQTNSCNGVSSYRQENVCWLNQYSLYVGFLVPVGISIVFNTYVYISVLKTIRKRGNSVTSTAKETSTKDYFFISITLITSTGVPWVIGYLMLLSRDQQYLAIVSWVYATVNTLQGFIIFLCTCVRNENMRNIWLTPILNSCCRDTGAKTRMLLSNSKSYELGAKNSTSNDFSNPGSTSGVNLTSTTSSIPLEKQRNGDA